MQVFCPNAYHKVALHAPDIIEFCHTLLACVKPSHSPQNNFEGSGMALHRLYSADCAGYAKDVWHGFQNFAVHQHVTRVFGV